MTEDFKELANTTVADLLNAAPAALHEFAAFHTACVGCGFSRFCLIADVAQAYRLDAQQFFFSLSKYQP